jgi:hypothetical protein
LREGSNTRSTWRLSARVNADVRVHQEVPAFGGPIKHSTAVCHFGGGLECSTAGNELRSDLLYWRNSEAFMYKLAIGLLLLSTPIHAQSTVSENPVTLQSCHPIGQTVKGEMIYSLDCPAITTQPAAAIVAQPGEVKASVIEHPIQPPMEPSR